MSDKYKISIIVPNYNCSSYIRKCLKSIFKQNFSDYELIIIDDGSDDGSELAINEVLSDCKDVKFKFIKQYNQNAAVARNRGLEIAKGEFVLFLDSDDELYDENTLQKIYDDSFGTELLMGNYCLVDKSSNTIGHYEIDNNILKINNKYKYVLSSPVPSNKLYLMNVIRENGLYFDNVGIGQDLNFFLKYLAVIEKIKVVDYDFYKYRVLSNSMTRTLSLKIMDIKRNFDCIKNYYKKNNKIEEYNRYVALAELNNYNVQMEKIVTLKSKKMKRMLYRYFIFCFDNINLQKIVDNDYTNQLRKKIFYKKYFGVLYLSSLYPLIKKRIKSIIE
ncbi:Glycosyl transferase family 2 [Lachnospiraceae bacterium]|nr:Glycosyl transferase family 2 [Lachnospiraceae bacterium]